jgi:GTP-binding protein
MRTSNHYARTRFLTSATGLHDLPPDDALEVAFAGRSNSGKSSALNVITDRKTLARTSKTPGRTRLVNVFEVFPGRHLVDLPGYGYAKVAAKVQRHWGDMLDAVLRGRGSLQGMMLLMDVRHPLTDLDQQMLVWCRSSHLPVHILLTKSDKLSRGKASGVLQSVRAWAQREDHAATAQLFSASARLGVDEARQQLDRWLQLT